MWLVLVCVTANCKAAAACKDSNGDNKDAEKHETEDGSAVELLQLHLHMCSSLFLWNNFLLSILVIFPFMLNL